MQIFWNYIIPQFCIEISNHDVDMWGCDAVWGYLSLGWVGCVQFALQLAVGCLLGRERHLANSGCVLFLIRWVFGMPLWGVECIFSRFFVWWVALHGVPLSALDCVHGSGSALFMFYHSSTGVQT